MIRSVVLVLLIVNLGVQLAVASIGPQVTVKLSSGRIGMFEHSKSLARWELSRLSSPSPADLKPFLVAAQKALADRLGYTEQLFGPRHFALADGRVVEITLRDEGDRVLYTYRPRTRSASAR